MENGANTTPYPMNIINLAPLGSAQKKQKEHKENKHESKQKNKTNIEEKKEESRKVSEEIVKVTLTRELEIQPANLLKLAVTMSVDIPVDSIEFGQLPDPKEFIRNSQPVRILTSYVSNIITNMSMNTILGPIVTPPNLQE